MVGLVALVVLGVASLAGAAKDRKPPTAPRIAGPAKTEATKPTFVFSARDDTTPVAKLRYRCAFDNTVLHACSGRYSVKLLVGVHTLFAQAVDLAGNRSKVSKFVVRITAPPPPPEHPDIAKVRAATDKYHDVNVAIADGYSTTGVCVASPSRLGVMGIHYENAALQATPEVVAEKPEILLYQPAGAGLELIGVEYFRRADQGSAPKLFEQTFDGPMAGHHPAMPDHYDLHVWVWKKNPSGMYAVFNPDAKCF